MMFSKNEVERKDGHEHERKDKRKENHKDKNTHKSDHKHTPNHKAAKKDNPHKSEPKIELLIYNCPFEKTYTTNTGALIRFTTK